MDKNSQSQIILKKLKSKKWVSLPEILDLKCRGMRISNHTARLSELRGLGHSIICITGYDYKLKCRTSEYHLKK